MAGDFFADFGATISKAAKDIGNRADSFVETQKIRSKILLEQKLIEKDFTDLGKMLYKKYVDGEPLDETMAELCDDVTQRKIAIAGYRETMAKMNGETICAACGASVPEDAAFCMQCGAPIDRNEEMDTVVNPTPAQEKTENIQKEAEAAQAESIMNDAGSEAEEFETEEVLEQEPQEE